MLTEPTVALELARVCCSLLSWVVMMCDLFVDDLRGEFEFVFGVVPRGLTICCGIVLKLFRRLLWV